MTVSLVQQLNTPLGLALSASVSATGAAFVYLDGETVPIGTDTLMNIAFPYATVKAYFLLATCDCTIETNATDHAGGQSIALTANVSKQWITGGDGSNVFSADVTKAYVTAAAAGTLKWFVLYDPTP